VQTRLDERSSNTLATAALTAALPSCPGSASQTSRLRGVELLPAVPAVSTNIQPLARNAKPAYLSIAKLTMTGGFMYI
jgi:hypothetical protein